MIGAALSKVLDGAVLGRDEMKCAMRAVLEGQAPAAQVAAMLGALRVRGESVEELVGTVLAAREAMVRVEVPFEVVDTCGTGGDGRGTFNISTAAAIVASSAGVKIAKHGNRAVSSRCGSADVLEALGVSVEHTVAQQQQLLTTSGLAFLHAPVHHPGFRAVSAVRRELAVRTLFNLVGPLANPAGARRQVIGVFDARRVELVAKALVELGAEHALVVHGDGSDEISVCGETLVAEVRDGRVTCSTLTPEALGLERHSSDALKGGDAHANARIIEQILAGERGAPRDAVVANAAAALLVGKEVESLVEGCRLAERLLDSGAAAAHFARFLRAQKGVTRLDDIVGALPRRRAARASQAATGRFERALRDGPAPRIIAELKRRSPSAGTLATIVDPAARARELVTHGARCLSVLTNETHFGGSLHDLANVRAAVDVPLLRKDFIIDPRQLDEAVTHGADAVLLMVSLLGTSTKKFLAEATARGLEALVEVHDESELRCALDAGARIIGINNRNLHDLSVDLSVSEALVAKVPPGLVVVAESGIRSRDDLNRLTHAGLENFLVGELFSRGGTL